VIEERLRLIRGFYDAMRRRDLEELQAFGRRFPDFEWRSAPDEIDHTPRLGAASALAYSRNLFELSAESETTIEAEIDLGPDRAILVVRHRMRGAEEAREAAGA
jgi:ketosteroid isomerase-like protein